MLGYLTSRTFQQHSPRSRNARIPDRCRSEERYELFGQTGRVLLTGFDSRGCMALLDQTISRAQTTGVKINTALVDVRQYRSRLGGVVGFEQSMTEAVGFFARVSRAAGKVEPYEFTDIDRSVAIGTSIKGLLWHRPEDIVGLVAIDDGLAAKIVGFD